MPAYIGWINHADTATLTAINPVTGLAAVMLRPLTELQIPWAKGLMRGPANGTVGDPASLKLRADLGAGGKLVHAIGLIGMNGVTNANMTVMLSNTAFGSYEVALGSASWEADVGQGSLNSSLLWFAGSFGLSARYIELNIEVSDLPAGSRHVDARRLMIMSGGGSVLGFDRGWSLFADDPTDETQTDMGGVFIQEKVASRVMQFAMTGRKVDEMRDNTTTYNNVDSLERVLMQAGKKKEVLVCPRDYATGTEVFQNAVYGRITSWSPIVHEMGNLYSCDQVVVKEIPHPPL